MSSTDWFEAASLWWTIIILAFDFHFIIEYISAYVQTKASLFKIDIYMYVCIYHFSKTTPFIYESQKFAKIYKNLYRIQNDKFYETFLKILWTKLVDYFFMPKYKSWIFTYSHWLTNKHIRNLFHVVRVMVYDTLWSKKLLFYSRMGLH